MTQSGLSPIHNLQSSRETFLSLAMSKMRASILNPVKLCFQAALFHQTSLIYKKKSQAKQAQKKKKKSQLLLCFLSFVVADT